LISHAYGVLFPSLLSPARGQPFILCDKMAQALKKKGNEFFVEGDYISAEDYYSQA
jgi:hypothetical protein